MQLLVKAKLATEPLPSHSEIEPTVRHAAGLASTTCYCVRLLQGWWTTIANGLVRTVIQQTVVLAVTQ